MKLLCFLLFIQAFTLFIPADSDATVFKSVNFDDYQVSTEGIGLYDFHSVVHDFGSGDKGIQYGSWGIEDGIPEINVTVNSEGQPLGLGGGNVFLVRESFVNQYFHPSPDSAHQGNSLMTYFAKNQLCKDKEGASWRSELPDLNTLYFSYDIFVNPTYDFRLAEKMPGVCGGTCNTGGDKPTGTDGWSVRFILEGFSNSGATTTAIIDGGASIYIYYPDQPASTTGNVMPLCHHAVPTDIKTPTCTNSADFLRLPKSQWANLQMQVTLNSAADAYDGEVKAWVNHELVGDFTGIRFWTGSGSIPINRMILDMCYGGQEAEFESPQDNYLLFDNFIAADIPITQALVQAQEPSVIQVDQVYPTILRSSQLIQVAITALQTDQVLIGLVDLRGNILSSQKYNLIPGSQTIPVMLGQVQSGLYILRVIDLKTNQITGNKIAIIQ